MIDFTELDKKMFVTKSKGGRYQLHIWKNGELEITDEEVVTVSEAFELAKKGDLFAAGESKASHLVFAKLQTELGRDIRNYLTLALIGTGRKTPLVYTGTDAETAEQYKIANALLGFEEIPDFIAVDNFSKEEIFSSLKKRYEELLAEED